MGMILTGVGMVLVAQPVILPVLYSTAREVLTDDRRHVQGLEPCPHSSMTLADQWSSQHDAATLYLVQVLRHSQLEGCASNHGSVAMR